MLFEGPLSKWTNVIQGWQYRFFVLDPTQGMLIYYTVNPKKKRIVFILMIFAIVCVFISLKIIWSKANDVV